MELLQPQEMLTARYDRTKYINEWIVFHHAQEVRSAKVFYKALQAQVKPVIDHINAYGGITSTISDLLVSKSPMEVAYEEVYLSVGVLSAGWNMRRINSIARSIKALPAFFSESWRKIMQLFYTNESADKVTHVTETTRERIREILDEADALNLTIERKATYITDQLSSSAFNRARSLVIARTESTVAANKGASLGNASADYETVKEWISIKDHNTRRSHMIADGQIVNNDEDFIVGTELAQYPGDPRLSAKEVIQCRCCVAYIPKLSDQGLPILK